MPSPHPCFSSRFRAFRSRIMSLRRQPQERVPPLRRLPPIVSNTVPQIISYDDMIATGNKGWRQRIKAPLEKALDAQIAVGYLTRWAYYQRDEELTKEQAGALSYEDFAALMVEYTPAEDIPDQTDRLIAKAERIAKAEKKKRGRPRKNKSE